MEVRVVILPLPGREVEGHLQQLDAIRNEVQAITGIQEFLDAEKDAEYRAKASRAWAEIGARANADFDSFVIHRLREIGLLPPSPSPPSSPL